ncbi:hypothetical protein ACOSP7_028365 [Xanthoceras sorbifolium]
MQPSNSSEVSGLQYYRLIPPNTSLYSSPTFHQFNRYLNPPLQIQEFNPHIKSSSMSSNNSATTTSDEAEEQQLSLINERKQRRMISNRESARRSRMRKQRHLDELWSQVVWLRNDNHQLLDKLNNVSESHDRLLNENTQLKEEATELRQMLADMQLNGSYLTLRDIEDIPCNTDLLN